MSLLSMRALFAAIIFFCGVSKSSSCSDFYMNFTEFRLSGRTMDLGSVQNSTVTTWPRSGRPVRQDQYEFWPARLGAIGVTVDFLGEDLPPLAPFYSDSMNEMGVSCSLLALVGTKYQEKDDSKTNIFAGTFCKYVAQTYSNVLDLQAALPKIAVWGPDVLDEHFVVRDSHGSSLVIEFIDGKQHVYLDRNDGESGFGIMTNEPTFNWHVENVQLYQWKRGLTRQAISIPGNFYPDERFMRVHMMKSGMQAAGLMKSTVHFQDAFALTAQILNSVSVPQGDQYGTDTGENSNEGSGGDHTKWALIRDHHNPALYWRNALNPSFRGLSLKDVDLNPGAAQKAIKIEVGPYYIDMSNALLK